MGTALLTIGLFALNLQAQQARDTDRKLDLEDLELALVRILNGTGTLPPAEQPRWCGVINDQRNHDVRAAIERSLRETKKYAKPEKPFPADPRFAGTPRDYVYWKTSPVSFELLSELEADNNNSRPLDLEHCALRSATDGGGFDYAISSVQRNPL